MAASKKEGQGFNVEEWWDHITSKERWQFLQKLSQGEHVPCTEVKWSGLPPEVQATVQEWFKSEPKCGFCGEPKPADAPYWFEFEGRVFCSAPCMMKLCGAAIAEKYKVYKKGQ